MNKALKKILPKNIDFESPPQIPLNPPMSHLENLVLGSPDAGWDYGALSENRNITDRCVTALSGKSWSYKRLSKNPSLSEDFVERHPPFVKTTYSGENGGERTVRAPLYDWDMVELAKRAYITMDFVLRHFDWGWPYISITCNPNVSEDFISKLIIRFDDTFRNGANFIVGRTPEEAMTWTNLRELSTEHHFWHRYSLVNEIPLYFLESHPELHEHYCWERISQQKNITYEFYKSHPDYDWHLQAILMYVDLTAEQIKEISEKLKVAKTKPTYIYQDFTKKYFNYTKHMHATGIDYILDNFDAKLMPLKEKYDCDNHELELFYYGLSNNKHLTFAHLRKIVEKYPIPENFNRWHVEKYNTWLRLNFKSISQTMLITLEDLLDPQNAEFLKHIYWPTLSKNSRLDLRIVIHFKNMDWSWIEICKNPMLTIDFINTFMIPNHTICYRSLSSNTGSFL